MYAGLCICIEQFCNFNAVQISQKSGEISLSAALCSADGSWAAAGFGLNSQLYITQQIVLQ